jgi:hypothetical protein
MSEVRPVGDSGPSAGERAPGACALRIGVMGYYGFGNVGDDILLANVRQMLSPSDLVPFQTDFAASEADIERLNGYDFLILGGGGLYNQRPARPFDTFHQWRHLLESPIGVLGLGVERLDRCFLQATHELVERAKFFIVRDAESKRLIGHPGVEVAPDLSFYRPFPVCDARTCSGQVQAGINLRPMANQTASWVDAVRALPCHKVAVPFSVVPTFDDREPLRLIDPACPDRFEPDAYQGLDFFIGTAFHSVVCAIQSGIPAIAISYHPKVRRLMEEAGLAAYVLRPDQADGLADCYERAWAAADRIRRQMLAFREQCVADWERRSGTIRLLVDSTLRERASSLWPSGDWPRVSILVRASADSSEEDLVRTVASCGAQTYPDCEVLVCNEAEESDIRRPGGCAIGDAPAHSGTTHEVDWVATYLEDATGDLVTWLDAGSKYAPDAIETLVHALGRHPWALGAKADYYLTHGGVIEQKQRADEGSASERLSGLLVCFLLKRGSAPAFRNCQRECGNTSKAEELAEGLIEIHHGLLFKSAADREGKLYRSSIMYGRGQTEVARGLLQEALVCMATVPYRHEIVIRAFLKAAFNPLISGDPVGYLKHVSDNWPSDEAKGFRRPFEGRAMLEAAYISRARGQTAEARRLLLRALRADQRWLHHRGTLGFLLELVGGRSTLAAYRRAKNAFGRLGGRGTEAASAEGGR